MNRSVALFLIVDSVFVAFGVDVRALTGAVAVLWSVQGAFCYMYRGQPPRAFWPTLLAIPTVPFMLGSLLRTYIGVLLTGFSFALNRLAVVVLVMLAAGISFGIVRARLRRRQTTLWPGQTNERQPLFPVRSHEGEEE